MSAVSAGLETIQVGDIAVTFVPDGNVRIRPADQYPAADPGLWTAEADSLDADGFMVMSVGAVLIQTASRNVLIDAGFGAVHANIADVTNGMREGFIQSGELLANLGALGVEPSEIELVCFTHLHGDHTGWLGAPGDPTFPDARYLLTRSEWEYWADPDLERSPAGPEAEHLALLNGNVEFLEDQAIPIEGVAVLPTPGHTPGHVAYVVAEGEVRVVVVGDVFHSAMELRHHGLSFIDDVDPVAAAAARRGLRAELTRPQTLLLAGHFSDRVIGRVVANGGHGDAESHRFEPI